jgi:hypothetical protein
LGAKIAESGGGESNLARLTETHFVAFFITKDGLRTAAFSSKRTGTIEYAVRTLRSNQRPAWLARDQGAQLRSFLQQAKSKLDSRRANKEGRAYSPLSPRALAAAQRARAEAASRALPAAVIFRLRGWAAFVSGAAPRTRAQRALAAARMRAIASGLRFWPGAAVTGAPISCASSASKTSMRSLSAAASLS